MLYFAYGSNCNPAILATKAVQFASQTPGRLAGYRLLFNKMALRDRLPEGVGFANIEPEESRYVEGVVYEVLDETVPMLDASERYPDHYTRVSVQVETDRGSLDCQAYQSQPDKTSDGLVPSQNYLNHLLSAREFFSRQYFETLEQSPTYQGQCACCHTHGTVLFLVESERTFMLCETCREAKQIWGEVRGHGLTVAETEAVVQFVARGDRVYDSLTELIQAVVERRIIHP